MLGYLKFTMMGVATLLQKYQKNWCSMSILCSNILFYFAQYIATPHGGGNVRFE